MQQVFIFQETKKMREILNSTHDDILSIMKRRNPKAHSFAEDNELCKLHDLFALINLQELKIEDHDATGGRIIYME